MSDDGADQGIMPERALKTVLGGEEQPTQDEKLNLEEFEDRVREAPIEGGSYDGSALACARMILEAVEKYPPLRQVPYESVYLRGGDGMMIMSPDGGAVVIQPGLHDVLKRLHPTGIEAEILADLTGFMWGWACNAVQRILGKDPVPNPAIVDIG